MSTWTFKGSLAALGLGLLGGCGGDGFSFGALPDQATRAALSRGAVLVEAPKGYCIDERALRRAPTGDFAMLARCDTLGFRGFFSSRQLALITVTTAPRTADTPAPGLADLEQSASPATVIETRVIDDLPLVRLDTSGESSVEGIAPQHWRSAFALNGQLVALALYAPDTAGNGPVAGAELLADLARRTRTASARPEEPAPPETDEVPAAAEPETPKPQQRVFPPLRLLGLIDNLFE